MKYDRALCAALTGLACLIGVQKAWAAEPTPQYELGSVKVPAASADEAKLQQMSVPLALEYLEHGALAWNTQRKCVTCHTNGIYMTIRPALSDKLGKPTESVRQFFVDNLRQLEAMPPETLKQATRPAQVIYTAAGLAEWDKHVTNQLSPETERALTLMFSIQMESGTWGTLDCWPPYESDAFHEATVAAIAVATATDWQKNLTDQTLREKVELLKKYLRTETPPHDYGRLLLLWASTRMPDLLDQNQKGQLIDMVWKHQREDGGWSIRTFAAPEAWGKGNRAGRLKAEPDQANPPSDGHQTGLAVIVLRESGVPASDTRLQKAIAWIKSNQRVTGRWWTKSLNTDSWHFITYSGTAFPLLALSLCDELPTVAAGETDERSVSARLTELGAQLTQSDGVVTKVFFKDCSKLGAAEFRLIGRLKHLKALTLYGQCKGLTDETLPYLSGLTELEELATDAMQVTDDGLAKLTVFTNVKSMAFFHPSFGMKGFDGHGFAALKSLPKLQRLTIAGTPFDDRGMMAIAELTQLHEFRTWHTYQTQAGNEWLTKLPELKSLWLGQRLRHYDGTSNAASLNDATFDVLIRLKGLESLTLDEAQLSLTALRRLSELPKLMKLELRRIDVSAADIESLKAALPSVTIDWKPLTDEEHAKLVEFLKQ